MTRKQTVTAIDAADAAMRELRKASAECTVREAVEETERGVKTLAERFNAMRADLASFITLVKGMRECGDRFVNATVALRHGDYGKLIDEERAFGRLNVEDAGLFAESFQSAAGRKLPTTRIQACIELNDAISAAIAGWKSKLDKMAMRSSLDGSSQAELDAAARKTVQFGEAIRTLRLRGGQVSDLFFATMREIEGFVAKAKSEFKVIYHQEKTGHERTGKD